MKRLFDILVSLIALVVLSPLLLAGDHQAIHRYSEVTAFSVRGMIFGH